MMNNIIPFPQTAQTRATETENTFNAIKFRMADSLLLRLLNNREITQAEYEQGRGHLAKRFKRDSHGIWEKDERRNG